MNRNEEYRALLEELESVPPALEGLTERVWRRWRQERRWRTFAIPVGSLAACFAAFVLLVNLSVPFARACGNVPVLRELAQAVAWSPSLSAAVENDYVQPIGLSQTKNGITATVEYIIVDQKQVNIFFTLEGDYEKLNAAMPEFSPDQVCSVIGSDSGQHPGTLLNFRLEYADQDVPDHLSMTFQVYTEEAGAGSDYAPDRAVGHADEMLELRPWEEPEVLAEFTFDLDFDPNFTAQGEVIPVNRTFCLDGQTLTVTDVEVYPTHVRVSVEAEPGNTAWLKSLEFYMENEDGDRFEPISNGIAATGDTDTPANASFHLESSYFAKSGHLTLHVTGAVWLDKNRERIRADLARGTVDWLPEGVTLQGMQHWDGGWFLTFNVAAPANSYGQVFSSRYFGEDGTEYSMDRYGWSVLDDHSEVYLPLRNYDQDAVLLGLIWSRATTAEPPITIPIK